MYVNTVTGEFPLYEGDIYLMNPALTPSAAGQPFVCPEGFAAVEVPPSPEIDTTSEDLVLSPAERTADGRWVASWSVVKVSDEVREARALTQFPPPELVDLGYQQVGRGQAGG